MRLLRRYPHSALAVHDACVSSASDATYLARLASMHHTVAPTAVDYSNRAANGDLYLIAPRKIPLNSPAIGSATRKDLKDLYERFMVGTGTAGRTHYDEILLSAPFERCPYCGVGRATTLDHYLPKSRYPQFSVTPDNLVPACKDCQGKKGRHVAASGAAQTLHPYFDDAKFFTTRWLFGAINRTSPVAVTFHADPPLTWNAVERQRVVSHFDAHNLGERFALEAATELAVLKDVLSDYRATGNVTALTAELARWARAHGALSINSWQSALYHALSNDIWYCSTAAI
jgi:hypothetical protein